MPSKKSKRADGRYQVSVTVGRRENGSLIRKYFYGETQKEANQKKKEYLAGIAVNSDAKNMTVKRWVEIWNKSYSKGGYRNRENNKSILNVFLRFLDHKAAKPINEIIPADISAFSDSISGCTKSHVKKCKYVINQLFESSIKNGYSAKNPCEGVTWESVKNKSRDSISDVMDKLILNNWHVHSAGKWAMLIRYAGLRPSEAFALDRSCITENSIIVRSGSHFEHGQLVITTDTTKSEAGQREIPILPPLKPVIEAMPTEGLVCRSATGKPISQSACKRNWTTFMNMLEDAYNDKEPRLARRTDCYPEDRKRLEKIDMYSLRHTYCSMLYDAGVDVKTAQYLMGHKDLEVTMKIYTHLSEKKKAKSYDALFALFKTDSKKEETDQKTDDVKNDVKTPISPENTSY